MAFTSVDDPSIYFNTKLYTGNGSTQSITGVNFQPDWVWIKSRTTTDTNAWYDAVRGATKRLKSNSTDAETTQSTALTSFDSDGFSIGAGGDVNTNSANYVAWNWKAGGSASSNSNGSITSSVSANTTAGFSIVSYTGAGGSSNVGHGLGVAPNFIIAKNRDSGSLSWFVSNDGIGWTKRLKLDGTNNAASNVAFGDTNPDSTKFYLQDNNLNTSGETHIAYCFANIQGFSKYATYVGNGNADGPFVYCGFRPAWVMIKNTSSSNDWIIFDNARDTLAPNNPVGRKSLEANDSAAEVTRTTKDMDYLSNGIKIRTADGTQNTSGETYFFMAFAESPFVNSNGIPNNGV